MTVTTEGLVKFSCFLFIIYYGLPIVNCLSPVVRAALCYLIIMLFIVAIILEGFSKNKRLIMAVGAVLILNLMIYYGKGFVLQGVSLEQKFRSLFMFWLPWFQGSYFVHKKSNIKTIGKLFLAVTFITCVTTTIGVIAFPMAPRMLAKSSSIVDKDIYYLKNIGGYGFVYSLIFLVPALNLIRHKTKNTASKIWLLCFELLGIICIILSQYTMAVILLVLILPFIIKKNLKLRNYILLLLIFVTPALFLLDFAALLNLISDFALKLELRVVSDRLSSIIQILYDSTLDGDASKRTQLYSQSFTAFMSNPISGNLFVNKFNLLGEHSELLDLMGGTGIIGITYCVLVFRSITKQLMDSTKDSSGKYLMFSMFMILLLALINTLFVAHQISLAIALGFCILLQENKSYGETAELTNIS